MVRLVIACLLCSGCMLESSTPSDRELAQIQSAIWGWNAQGQLPQCGSACEDWLWNMPIVHVRYGRDAYYDHAEGYIQLNDCAVNDPHETTYRRDLYLLHEATHALAHRTLGYGDGDHSEPRMWDLHVGALGLGSTHWERLRLGLK